MRSPLLFSSLSLFIFQAMKSCDVQLSDADVARLALRFDEEESRRVDIQKFMRFVRGERIVDVAVKQSIRHIDGYGLQALTAHHSPLTVPYLDA